MKFFIILGLLCVAAAAQKATPPEILPGGSTAVVPATPPPPPTLGRDLKELFRYVPAKPLKKLVIRYLLNDATFQAFIRTVNSQDAFIVRMRFNSQPELIAFNMWTQTQIMLSGGKSLKIDDSAELSIMTRTPYWMNNVFGWQGFVNEFLAYYPQDMIRAHINMKVMENGIFAQYWARLKALKPVYERVLSFPETQRIITQLQTAGVDTNQLDQFIRTQFDWLNLPAAGAIDPATGLPITPVPLPAPVPVMG